MAGLKPDTPNPTEIKLHSNSRMLELSFDDGSHFELSCEFLRIHSPSAAVRGHGVGQGILQTGKRNVEITSIVPVGNYAVQLVFSDGHDSGIYSWDILYDLGANHDALWQDYLQQLEAAGANRDVDSTTPPPAESGHSCSKH